MSCTRETAATSLAGVSGSATSPASASFKEHCTLPLCQEGFNPLSVERAWT